VTKIWEERQEGKKRWNESGREEGDEEVRETFGRRGRGVKVMNKM
jgi:hypothetical protein